MTEEKAHRVRASDPEREEYAELLRAAMREGRLTMDEGEQRLAKVYAAVYRDELSPQVEDLPGGGWSDLAAGPEFREKVRKQLRWRGVKVAVVATVVVTVWAVLASVGHLTLIPLIPLAFFLFIAAGHRRHRRWHAMQGWPGPQGPQGWQGGPWGHGHHGESWGPGWRR
jgi:hypothetical protein